MLINGIKYISKEEFDRREQKKERNRWFWACVLLGACVLIIIMFA